MKRSLLLLFVLLIASQVILAGGKKDQSKAAGAALPGRYELSQNYPNPFNPDTRVSIYIAKEEYVTLKLYNIIGQEVLTVLSENMSSGEHQVVINGSGLKSGVYFYTLTAGGFSQTKRMTLLK